MLRDSANIGLGLTIPSIEGTSKELPEVAVKDLQGGYRPAVYAREGLMLGVHQPHAQMARPTSS